MVKDVQKSAPDVRELVELGGISTSSGPVSLISTVFPDPHALMWSQVVLLHRVALMKLVALVKLAFFFFFLNLPDL